MWKLKHANSILESLEYFYQISAKLILTIFSYTVSKLVHFLRQRLLLLLFMYITLDNHIHEVCTYSHYLSIKNPFYEQGYNPMALIRAAMKCCSWLHKCPMSSSNVCSSAGSAAEWAFSIFFNSVNRQPYVVRSVYSVSSTTMTSHSLRSYTTTTHNGKIYATFLENTVLRLV